jgi:hypothetical protein
VGAGKDGRQEKQEKGQVNLLLIKNGFAREYYGEAKQSWCN